MTIVSLLLVHLKVNHLNQNILPIHKNIVSTCSYNNTTVRVHILYIVKKSPTSPMAYYFLAFTFYMTTLVALPCGLSGLNQILFGVFNGLYVNNNIQFLTGDYRKLL